MTPISEILYARRSQLGLNLTQMAEKLSVKLVAYSNYERGDRIPNGSFYERWKLLFEEELPVVTKTKAMEERTELNSTADNIADLENKLRYEALLILAESARNLAESHLINSKNIERLIGLLDPVAVLSSTAGDGLS